MPKVLALKGEGRKFDPMPLRLKQLKLVFTASPLRMQHLEVRAKTGRSRVGIMCQSKVAYLTADFFLN